MASVERVHAAVRLHMAEAVLIERPPRSRETPAPTPRLTARLSKGSPPGRTLALGQFPE